MLADPWDGPERIVKRVEKPRFPDRTFPITRYGAVEGRDCTEAFRNAITGCSDDGGGHVVVPAGTYLSGAIHLLSNVDLHLEPGARIRFRPDPEAYLPAVFTRWQGIELMSYSPLIYAFEQENVAVTGEGTLYGGGDESQWWPWKGKAVFGWRPGTPSQEGDWGLLQSLAERGVPPAQRLFGAGHHLRPSFIQPYKCRNVLVEGVRIEAAPWWVIHPVLCQNVTVEGVTVASLGPNNDGCDPESCEGVVVRSCHFDTGDDCIALKAGRNADGRRLAAPCRDVLIEDCDFRRGHGGVTIGSEMTGGVSGVFVRRCRMDSPELNIALRFKTNAVRGGFIEDFHAREIHVGQVAGSAIEVDFFYEEGDAGRFPPRVDGIDIRDLSVARAGRAFSLRGHPSSPIGRVALTDCRFDRVDGDPISSHVQDLQLHRVFVGGKRIDPLQAGSGTASMTNAGT